MSQHPQTYFKRDPESGELMERVTYSAADVVAAEFAGYTADKPTAKSSTAKAAGASTTEKNADKAS